jgi:hypothetical protein
MADQIVQHPRARNLSGQRFGRLTAIEPTSERVNKKIVWKCACECGAFAFAASSNLINGHTTSCGCVRREVRLTHGLSATRAYRSWVAMMARCYDRTHKGYHSYGGRGITACDRWLNVEAFIADMGPRPCGTSIERVDNSKGYQPDNCKWATPKQQGRNRRSNRMLTANGLTLCVADWADRVGLSKQQIADRLRLGWSDAAAVTTPKLRRGTRGDRHF